MEVPVAKGYVRSRMPANRMAIRWLRRDGHKAAPHFEAKVRKWK